MGRSGLVVAQTDLAHRRECMAGDGKHRDRSLRAVGDQCQRSGAIDRHAGGALARLQLRRDPGRRSLEIDHRELVVGDGLLRIGRIDFGCPGDERETLIARNRHAGRWADHAGRGRDLGEDLGWRRIEINDGDGIGWRIRRHRIYAVDENGFPVIGGQLDINAASESAPIPPIWRCMRTSRCADRHGLANAPRTRPHSDHHNKRIGKKRALRSPASADHARDQSPAAAGSGRALAVRSALSRSASRNARSIDCSALSRGSQTVW